MDTGGVALLKTATDDNIRISQQTHASIQAVNDAANAFTELKLDGSTLLLNSQSNGNVGIGTSTALTGPSPATALRIGNQINIYEYDDGSNPVQMNIDQNIDANENYITTDHAARYQMRDGVHKWFTTGSGTAGTATNIGAGEAMRIDSSGRLLIGNTDGSYASANADNIVIGDRTSSSESGITFGSTVASSLRFADSGTTQRGLIQYVHNDTINTDYMNFYTANVEAMRIDSSGRVGIGGVPNTNWRNDIADQEVLMLGTEATFFADSGVTTELWNNAYVDNDDVFKNISTRGASRYFQYEGAHKWFTAASASAGSNIGTEINTSPKMTLDVSGNLLVSTTNQQPASTSGVEGFSVYAGGQVQASKNGATVARFNRNSSDGDIVQFRKDGATVGSIGVDNTDNLTISGNSSHCGLNFSTDDVNPYKNGAYTNGTTSLGSASTRFKDLYLSGGVVFGTGGPSPITSNTLDDYEEGSYDVSIVMDSGTVTLASDYDGMKYIKIGRMVTVQGQIRVESVSNPSGLMKISLPFAIDQTSDEGRNISGCVPRLYQASVPSGGLYPYLTTVFNLGAYAQLEWVRNNATTINHVPAADEYYIINFNYFTA